MECYFVSPDDADPSDHDDDSGLGVATLPLGLLARHGARVLNPSAVPVANGWPAPMTTVYRTRTLLVPPRLQQDQPLGSINDLLATRVGMRLVPLRPDYRAIGPGPIPAVTPVTMVLVSEPRPGQIPLPVDAWTALTALRDAVGRDELPDVSRADVQEISLEHLMRGGTLTGSPEIHGSPE